jgi:hypothetical protein
MSYTNSWKSGTAVLIALGLTAGNIAPLVVTAPASAQTAFPDVPAGYWAANFIQALVSRGVIAGFAEDGTFRPEDPVTRAQFAAMVNKAFNRSPIRGSISFVDVPAGYWATAAIQKAYTTGFLAGYPGNVFRPDERIPRAQVLVSLANGLTYASTSPVDPLLAGTYSDADQIPSYARASIAAATERRLVVDHPDLRFLNPNQVATRAEVAAFIYQALVSEGQVAAIPSPYIVGGASTLGVKIPAGTTIPVRYDQAQKILLAKNETQPTPLTLKVAQNIVDSQGRVLIPAGSDVVGQLQTVQTGAQFTASELVLPNGRRLPISATSEVITKTEKVSRGLNTTNIIIGTVVGAGAGAGVAGVTGDRSIDAWKVLTGAAAGAILGTLSGKNYADLIVINPNTDLTLTLSSDLVLSQQ